MIERWMTAEEIRDYLAISRGSLDKLIRDGLPCVRLNRLLRFDRKKVDRWLSECEITQSQLECVDDVEELSFEEKETA